jgi:hypothetical protein
LCNPKWRRPGAVLPVAGEKSVAHCDFFSAARKNPRKSSGTVLGLSSDMTEKAMHRLSLVLALAGALMVFTRVYSDFWFSPVLPAFEKSSPNLTEWPQHIYLPIG